MNPLQKLWDYFEQQGMLAKLIILNFIIYLTINVIGNIAHVSLLPWLALPLELDTFIVRFWTFFSYMFTHEYFGHLLWNMILLFLFSQVMFNLLGDKKLLYVYVMSGIAGAVTMLLVAIIMPAQFSSSMLLGASAAVLGVGAWMAILAPDYRVMLWGIINMPFSLFFLLVFIMSTVIDLSINTGGKIAHLGGTVFGLTYGYYQKNGLPFNWFKRKNTPLKIVHRNASQSSLHDLNEETRMNLLLDKISKSGYDSLSKVEKEELFKLSKRK